MAGEWKKWDSNPESLDPRGRSITTALNYLTCHWIFQVALCQELDKDGTDSKFTVGNPNRTFGI